MLWKKQQNGNINISVNGIIMYNVEGCMFRIKMLRFFS
jgi:hypothetical protein